jgi:hypothetical protein
MEGLRKTTHILGQDSQCPGRILYECVVYLMTPSTVINYYMTLSDRMNSEQGIGNDVE